MMAGLTDLFDAVRQFVAESYPGRIPVRVTIHLYEGQQPVDLPVPGPSVASASAPPPRPGGAVGAEATELTEYQAHILTLLEFRALRSDALVDELGGDRRRLWKPGGIKELVEAGLVALDRAKKLGYYRPDAPPDELSAEDHAD